MIRKIYNLFFSPKQLAYQCEAYDSLSFWEAYRGRLIVVFIFSWIISIFIFKIETLSIILLTPLYGFFLILIWAGKKGAIIMLLVFWLIEKINNLPYLIIEGYKFVIVLALGFVFFPLALRTLEVEYGKKNGLEPLKKKSVRGLVCFLLALVLICLSSILGYSYYSFAKARMSFYLENQSKQTIVNNTDFGVSFSLDDICRIDSDILNHLIDDSLWAGELHCQKSKELTVFIVTDDQVDHDWQTVAALEGIYTYDRGAMWNIIIAKPESDQKLVIGGYDYNKNSQEQILNNIKYIAN
ncbi:MAG: hypothetical protein C3F02_03485 [Parcubacteria group bacterium]|nr:MAG: hypothetical protein C3F02_03485 [Parcubacteria group bacterium]